jgi:hypothetical protein
MKIHMWSLSTVIVLLTYVTSSAQTTVPSSDGDGLFRAPGAAAGPGITSMLTFKSDDASVKLSFATPAKSGTEGLNTFGADISVKSAQGIGALVKNGTYTPGTKINGYFLRHSLLTDVSSGNSVDWLTLQGTISASEVVLFDGARPYAEQIDKSNFIGSGIRGTYAWEHAGWLLIGGTLGAERAHNYSDLKDVAVTSETTYVDPVSGNVRAVNADSTAAKHGTYVKGTVGIVRADLFFYPSAWADGRFGMTFYQSNRLSSDTPLRRSDIGVGFAFLKKGSPTIALGSIVIELKDMLNSQRSTDSVGRRISVCLQGSVPISPKFGF